MPASWRTGRRRVPLMLAVASLVASIGAGCGSARTGDPSSASAADTPPASGAAPSTGASGSAAPSHSAAPSAGARATAGPAAPRSGGIWRPKPGTTWQWQIVDPVSQPFRNVQMYDIDLTDAVPAAMTVPVAGFRSVRWPKGVNAGVIGRLHAAGKVAICYLDTGAWESYEPDAGLFPGSPGWHSGDPASDVVLNSTGWDNEYWLDIRRSQWTRFAPILWARLDVARRIGCDGVEPDENNPIGNNPGPAISTVDEKAWYLQVAAQAHARGLSVGMKNGVEVTDAQTAAAFDWNLNEECFFYDECDTLAPFVRAGKAVFQTEYTSDWRSRSSAYASEQTLASSGAFCASARQRHFATLVKNETPDATFVHC